MAFDFEDDTYENIFSEAITINKYTSQGFEFSSDHKTLLMAPKDIIEFEVPDFVTTIGPSAFKGCKMLERIVLHNSIRSIAKDAFEVINYKNVNGIFYIEVKDHNVNVEPYEYYDRHAIVTVNPTNLMKLLEGKLDPIEAYNKGKVVVDGDAGAVLTVINLVK